MQKRWIVNLVLALVILGLALFVYFKPAGEPEGVPLTTLNPDSVMSLRIERREGQPVLLLRTLDDWRMQAPVQARANRYTVANLLRIASARSTFQTPVDAAALAGYGLDKPAARLMLNDQEILIGAMHPMRPQHYVRYRDTVHLVDSQSVGAALLGYGSFIDSQLIEDGRKITGIAVDNVKLALHDGVWRREPHDPKISVDTLNNFVAQWQNARALSVERLSSAPALDEVEIMTEKDGKPAPLKLRILAYRPEFILARRDEGLQYHFPEDVGKRMLTLDASEKQ